MARQYGAEKVRLDEALALVAELSPISSSDLVRELAGRFRCSPRTAEDAITVLSRGRWIESLGRSRQIERTLLPSLYDRGRRYYRISDRGRQLLAQKRAGSLLRLARKLFTSCPSAGVRGHRNLLIALYGSEDEALRRFEAQLFA